MGELSFGYAPTEVESQGIRGIRPVDPRIFPDATERPTRRTYIAEEVIEAVSKTLKEEGLEGLESKVLMGLKTTMLLSNLKH